ncbi:glycosyltransferase family 2 protein [Desulfogranum mediterraneum]|uniref:glycosyltransferase family 2 protein n=1 Tax=Desulfogranum mediterraneum TaxID=160661 RepID=UPI000688101C|nr:glycosyltransferase family 2 protein [Desulfogranum mediterraneum]
MARAGISAHSSAEPAPAAAPSGARVLAVVVSYQPEPQQLAQLCASLDEQLSHTLLVDNGSGAGLPAEYDPGRLSVLVLGENHGIGHAQNQGLAWALTRDFSHLLLLDQDSLPASGMVDALLAAEAQLIAQGIAVAAVGPCPVSGETRQAESFALHPEPGAESSIGGLERVRYLHASGTLVRLEVMTAVGGMDGSLFIDLVDMEWCFRAAALGRYCFGVAAARLYHQVGWKQRLGFGPLSRRISVHPPLRSYYQLRNSLLLFRKRWVPKSWLCSYTMRKVLLRCMVLLLVAPGRRQRWIFLLRGIWDGLTGVRGPYRYGRHGRARQQGCI